MADTDTDIRQSLTSQGQNITRGSVGDGKLSFDDQKLLDNTRTLLQAVMRAKPATAKGKYVKSVYVSSTMGPGIAVDPEEADVAA